MTRRSITQQRAVLDDLTGLLDSLPGPPAYRQDLADPTLPTWSYLPGDRAGLCLEDAGSDIVDLVRSLLRQVHSRHGATLVREAMAVERERRRAVTGVPPQGDRYWWRMIGDPRSDQPWGWRLNGHHLAVHVIVDGDQVTFTPHFVGSEPAQIIIGPLNGRRILGAEEDLARSLLVGLTSTQRRQAVFDTRAPDDLLTGMDPVADPSRFPPGIDWQALTEGQRDQLMDLIDRYLARLPDDQARAYRRKLLQDSDNICFGWAGSGQPGQPHYYYVMSPTLLIEYDNTQDDANHAHSVLRHLRDDFGGDALRDHLRHAHAASRAPLS